MEIFNIHILEFLLIGGLALIVFGPERLPEVGRFLGQQVARFLAWQQQSPELQMLNEVRGEFEREIASLRDELVRTRNQLDMSRDMSALKEELRPMLDLKGSLNAPANGVAPAPENASIAPPETPNSIAPPATPETPNSIAPPAPAEPAAEALLDVADAAGDLAGEPPLLPRPAAQTVPAAARPDRLALTEPSSVFAPKAAAESSLDDADERAAYLAERRRSLHDAPPPDELPADSETSAGEPGAPVANEAELLRRLGELSTTLQALVGELQERGVIGADWRVPAPSDQETISR